MSRAASSTPAGLPSAFTALRARSIASSGASTEAGIERRIAETVLFTSIVTSRPRVMLTVMLPP